MTKNREGKKSRIKGHYGVKCTQPCPKTITDVSSFVLLLFLFNATARSPVCVTRSRRVIHVRRQPQKFTESDGGVLRLLNVTRNSKNTLQNASFLAVNSKNAKRKK